MYRNASEEIEKKIQQMSHLNKITISEATEEYLAILAEKGFKNQDEISFWGRVKSAFLDMLRQVGICLRVELRDSDLRHILGNPIIIYPKEQQFRAIFHTVQLPVK